MTHLQDKMTIFQKFAEKYPQIIKITIFGLTFHPFNSEWTGWRFCARPVRTGWFRRSAQLDNYSSDFGGTTTPAGSAEFAAKESKKKKCEIIWTLKIAPMSEDNFRFCTNSFSEEWKIRRAGESSFPFFQIFSFIWRKRYKIEIEKNLFWNSNSCR